jgi:hypothetical protein
MPEVETGRFTVGVFQNVAEAERGIEALKREGLPAESLTVLGAATPELGAMIERAIGATPVALDVHGLGSAVGCGPMLEPLQGGDKGLTRTGLAGTMRRVGFQPHDGRLYETLAGRGGVLVAVQSEPRAADALAVLFSYGGGNAAIGAWSGRV